MPFYYHIQYPEQIQPVSLSNGMHKNKQHKLSHSAQKMTEDDSQRVFLNDEECTSIFQIPSHLLKSFGPVLPSKVSLRVDESGKEWRVSVEKFKDHYFFTDGWKKFAKQVDLKSLDFLTFTSGSSSKQHGKNKNNRSGKVKATSSILNEDEGSDAETMLSFSREMKKHHRYRLDIPKDFISSTRIGKYEIIRLKDGKGREWPVRVSHAIRGHLTMCGGWGDFVIGNKVMLGSTISFTWISTNMVQTQIVEVGTYKQLLCSTAINSKGKLLQLS